LQAEEDDVERKVILAMCGVEFCADRFTTVISY